MQSCATSVASAVLAASRVPSSFEDGTREAAGWGVGMWGQTLGMALRQSLYDDIDWTVIVGNTETEIGPSDVDEKQSAFTIATVCRYVRPRTPMLGAAS